MQSFSTSVPSKLSSRTTNEIISHPTTQLTTYMGSSRDVSHVLSASTFWICIPTNWMSPSRGVGWWTKRESVANFQCQRTEVKTDFCQTSVQWCVFSEPSKETLSRWVGKACKGHYFSCFCVVFKHSPVMAAAMLHEAQAYPAGKDWGRDWSRSLLDVPEDFRRLHGIFSVIRRGLDSKVSQSAFPNVEHTIVRAAKILTQPGRGQRAIPLDRQSCPKGTGNHHPARAAHQKR